AWPPGDPDRPFLPLSVMVLPLHLGGRVIGVLSAGSARPAVYSEREVALFGFVADLLAGVLAHWWTDLQWMRQNDLLAQFDKTLAAGADPAGVLTATAAAARDITGMDAAVVIAAGAADQGSGSEEQNSKLKTQNSKLVYAAPGSALSDRSAE